MNVVSKLCLLAGILAIPLAIGVWMYPPDMTSAEFANVTDISLRIVLERAHAERWGLFVGIWAPTLISLSIAFKMVED